MADKGKGPMHSNTLVRELGKEEKWHWEEDNLRRWWETQRGIDFDLPVPEECFAPHVAPTIPLGATTSSLTPTTTAGPSQIVASRPSLPPHSIDIPQSSPPVVTDRIRLADLQALWDWVPAPENISQSPWYRLKNGYVRFLHGESWEYIDWEERAYARRREAARRCGIPVLEESPPQQPKEVILRWKEENPLDPPPMVEEEDESENESEDEDDGDDDFWVEVERRNIPDDEDNLSVGSNASIIMEEITEVPSSRRNLP